MRLLALIFVLSLVVACGKESTSRSSASACEGGSCEGVRREQNMERPTELLEAKVDTTIKLTDSEIVFLQDASSFVDSANTNCRIDVKAGDRYKYAHGGEALEIFKPDGKKFTMKRMSYSDESLSGSWAWRGYEGDVYKVYQYTFIGNGRMIIRLHCEY